MNPYDFVPIDFQRKPERREPLTHEKFQGKAGRITCQLTAETPIFIPEAEAQDPKPFITRNGLPIIPGSSLKGLLRNLVETVANGCFLLFDGKYERYRVDYTKKLPRDFRRCRSNRELCIACRMFGMLERRDVFLGNVSISDAMTKSGQYTAHRPIYTTTLMGPKPRHRAFYLDPSGQYIAGRKFYFHSPNKIYTDRSKTPYNQHICPLDKGSIFTFTVDFRNLQDDELSALLYAVVLEPGMRHKTGLAKPLGLGSVKIEIENITLIDYQRRYTDQAAPDELTGSVCEAYISDKIVPFINNTTSDTLNALRRIWKWDPKDRTSYVYPNQSWFRTHSRDSINKTP